MDFYRSVDIEFEVLCSEKGYNKDLLEPRYLTLSNPENVEKLKIVNVSMNKTELNSRVSNFDKGKLVSARPIPTSILNLVSLKNSDNSLIVNIEDRTYITVIKNGNFDNVEIIPDGMNDILDKINNRENSYSKAYEICKNTTISNQGLNIEEGNEYVEFIMPTLFKIANKIKDVISDFDGDIGNIYITGSGSSINNIDLYLQDFLDNIPCEILKPKFLEAGSLKVSIKDYIEVNSAIALALDGLGMGIKELNFASVSKVASITSSFGSINTGNIQLEDAKASFKAKLDPIEKLMFRVIGTACIFLIGYGVISNSMMGSYEEKLTETESTKTTVVKAISSVSTDQKNVNSITNQYKEQIEKLKRNDSGDNYGDNSVVIPKDVLPNFLNQLMFAIPQYVTVDSIANTTGVHISIDAHSKEYQQIGLFKAILYNKGLLKNVTSTYSYKEGEYVRVTIEGDLP